MALWIRCNYSAHHNTWWKNNKLDKNWKFQTLKIVYHWANDLNTSPHFLCENVHVFNVNTILCQHWAVHLNTFQGYLLNESVYMFNSLSPSDHDNNGLLPDGTKPLPEPMLIPHQYAVTEHTKCLFSRLKILLTIYLNIVENNISQKIVVCCLMTPSHYLNRCWLIFVEVQWYSSEGNFTRDASATNHYN